MRYLLLIIAIALVCSSVQAQVGIKLNLNVGSQPIWGPTGYDHVEYYYLPDIEAYYNVPQQRFYYKEGGRWIGRQQLPSRYRNYDFYNSYKVVVNERDPYRHHKKYRDEYSSYKGRHDQQPIRDSHDSKYYANKNHPEHNTWMKQQQNNNDHDGGKRDGNYKDNNKGRNKRPNKGH